jgi:hypothetical protein
MPAVMFVIVTFLMSSELSPDPVIPGPSEARSGLAAHVPE